MNMHCENDAALFDFESNSTREFLLTLSTFQRVYAPVHGRICVVLCLFGVFTNLIHCVVLTRPSMRNSAVNCIMTAVALCDMGTMASYFVYILHFVIQKTPQSCSNAMTYWWMFFLLIHMFLSITLHTSTLWLAVAMAFMRRMTLRAATLNSRWQKAMLAKRICFCVLGVVVVLSIPTLMVHEILVYPLDRWTPPRDGHCDYLYPENYTETLYTIAVTKSAVSHGCMIFKTNLWLSGILFKVIPCVLLILLSGSLMWKLRQAEKKRRSFLLTGGASNDTNKSLNPDRTTAMLLAIVTVFLVTELPQGALAILNGIYTSDVHRYIYFNLGDILDLLSLMNSSVNFVLYCLMSSRYRNTFCSLILPISKCRCVSSFASAPGMGAHGGGVLGGGIGLTQFSHDYASRTRFDLPEFPARRRSSPAYRVMREPSSAAQIPLSTKVSDNNNF
ncbi:serpentine type 7TM GPCR chemoreceptor srw domain-containing protein [Ditylenchus destructor]|nr:serpentine type 7TM GPCR chemoreceptor srw domain-containing protein [Ditylenchus destructor]